MDFGGTFEGISDFDILELEPFDRSGALRVGNAVRDIAGMGVGFLVACGTHLPPNTHVAGRWMTFLLRAHGAGLAGLGV